MEYFDFLNGIINDHPFFSAFLLGLFVAINPCSLAANISALGLLSYNNEANSTLKSGMIFTAGKSAAYFTLAIILYLFAGLLDFSHSLQHFYGKFLGIFFIIAGVLMLDIIHIHGAEHKVLSLFKNKNAFVLGLLLAYAFCPDGGIMYFGMLIPLSVREGSAVVIPLIFTIGSAIPMLVLSFVIARSTGKIASIKEKIDGLYEVIRKFFGVLFIIIGTWFVVENFFHNHSEHKYNNDCEHHNRIEAID